MQFDDYDPADRARQVRRSWPDAAVLLLAAAFVLGSSIADDRSELALIATTGDRPDWQSDRIVPVDLAATGTIQAPAQARETTALPGRARCHHRAG